MAIAMTSKLVVLTFTSQGERLVKKLAETLPCEHYPINRLEQTASEVVSERWKEAGAFLFVGATGIAVRVIAPLLVHKSVDPAVLVADDGGNFVISLLSGHLGGANEKAITVARLLGAQPVITTASDNRGFQALDLYAAENGLTILDFSRLTTVQQAMVEGMEIGLFTEVKTALDYPFIAKVDKSTELEKREGCSVAITSEIYDGGPLICSLVPKNLNVGVGCRRGVAMTTILEAIDTCFEKIGRRLEGIGKLGSIDIKSDEEGLVRAAERLGVPLTFFTADQLAHASRGLSHSSFVKKTTGSPAVSGPSALLLGGELLIDKYVMKGVTVSVTKV